MYSARTRARLCSSDRICGSKLWHEYRHLQTCLTLEHGPSVDLILNPALYNSIGEKPSASNSLSWAEMAPENLLIKLRHAFPSASEGMFYFFRLDSSSRLSGGRWMVSTVNLRTMSQPAVVRLNISFRTNNRIARLSNSSFLPIESRMTITINH